MRTFITLIFITALYANAFSQFVSSNRLNTSKDKIYNKITGKQLSNEELIQIITKNPHVSFDREINKYGKIDYYVYDPNKKESNYDRDISKRPKNGEEFPPFVMKSIDNKTIDSEKLIGKNILLQFQLDFNKPFFNYKALDDANALIKELQNAIELTSIVITRGSTEDIIKEIDTAAYQMAFVSDAQNFNLKYIIINFPSFILVDKNGHLVSYYKSDELSKIKEDLLSIK